MAPQEIPPVDPMEDDPVEEDPVEDDPVEDDPVEDDPDEDVPTEADHEGSESKVFYAPRRWPRGYDRSPRDYWAEDAQSRFEK